MKTVKRLNCVALAELQIQKLANYIANPVYLESAFYGDVGLCSYCFLHSAEARLAMAFWPEHSGNVSYPIQVPQKDWVQANSSLLPVGAKEQYYDFLPVEAEDQYHNFNPERQLAYLAARIRLAKHMHMMLSARLASTK
tara:strand:+ start:543 stop:959 length:417 start_codon:yes stop_codon:yes gene_type:complete